MKIKACFLLFGLTGLLYAPNQSGSAPWKYDFQPGDHLVYHYVFERTVSGGAVQSQQRITYNSHIMVAGRQPDRISLGFQRNRESAQLLYYKVKGEDALAAQLPGFDKEISGRSPHFSEANEISDLGKPLSAWQATREETSDVLVAIHEVEALPVTGVEIGDRWRGSSALGFEFKFASTEDLGGKTCQRVEGTAPGGTKHLNYLWCPEIGAIGKLEFVGDYTSESTGETIHEHVSFELQQRKRNESLDTWLKSADTQQGALQALTVSKWVPLTPDQLLSPLQSPDSEAEALALACLYQRKMQPPSRELVGSLAHSDTEEVRRLAREVLEPATSPKTDAAKAKPGGICASNPAPDVTYATQKPGTTLRTIHSGEYTGYTYMLHIPKDYRGDRPFPMLVYLSGGSTGLAIDGVNSAEKTVAPSEYVVLYPQAGDLWWNEEVPRTFDATLEEALKDLNIDRNRIYIAGFSNGGTGALYYASLWPQRFAAIASLMGSGQCVSGIGAALPNVADIPVLFLHGDQDKRIPMKCSDDTYQSLLKISTSGKPEFEVMKDRTHDIDLLTDEGRTLKFFQDKERRPYPTKLSVRIQDLQQPRRYWVEVVRKGGPLAEVDAEITPDNTVTVTTKDVDELRLLLRPDMFHSRGPVKVILNGKQVFHGKLGKDCKLFQQSGDAWGDPALGFSDQLDFEITPLKAASM
jgi:hypothetical protein